MRKFNVILVLILSSTILFAQEFKTIGYLPHYRFQKLDQISFEKVTHVNISFGNPDMDGNITLGDGKDISEAVEMAHDSGAKAFIALAGGYLEPDWAAAWEHNMVESRRSSFIHKITQYVKDHQLDGVDMDLEWQHVNELYSPFVIELADSLQAHEKIFTAALPGTYRYPEISDEALLVFDWINLMAYDLRGPWLPSDAGPHSPYSFAVSSINYWRDQGVESERLTLGVPFYGYDFSDLTETKALTFHQIVELNNENAYLDQAGDIYYNGIPTIINKTELAMSEVGGIMIWELGQDHFSAYSLLNSIFNTVNGFSNTAEIDQMKFRVEIFPNPASEEVNVQFESIQERITLYLIDVNGHLVKMERFSNTARIQFLVAELPVGNYVMHLLLDENSVIKWVSVYK